MNTAAAHYDGQPEAARSHKRLTKANPTECPACHGIGYTVDTSAEVVKDADGKQRTIKQGSSCPRCHGTGRLGALR